jgi:hypothetical protein
MRGQLALQAGLRVRRRILSLPVNTGPNPLGKRVSSNEGAFPYYSAEYPALLALTDYLWEDCCKRGKPTCC